MSKKDQILKKLNINHLWQTNILEFIKYFEKVLFVLMVYVRDSQKEIFERNQLFKIVNSFDRSGKCYRCTINSSIYWYHKWANNPSALENVLLFPPFQNFPTDLQFNDASKLQTAVLILSREQINEVH